MVSASCIVVFYLIGISLSFQSKRFQYSKRKCVQSYYPNDTVHGVFSDDHIDDVGCTFMNSTLETILLNNNKIRMLSSCAFTNSASLTYLNLSHNEISNYSIGAFDGLSSLLTLCLDNNNLQTLHEHLFKDLDLMHSLHLGHNRISLIEPAVLLPLIALSTLNLEHNLLSSIDSSTSIEETATSKELIGKPQPYGIRPHFQKIHLGHNQIESIDIFLSSSQRDLEELYLRHNSIRNFDSGLIIKVPNLRILDLSDNQIISMDINMIFKHSVLEVLDLSYNKLTKMGNLSIEPTSAIPKVLNLSHNSLRRLPSFNSSLIGFTKLDFSYNPLQLIEIVPVTAADEIYLVNAFESNVNLSCLLRSYPHAKSMHISSNQNDRSFLPVNCPPVSAKSKLRDLTANRIGLQTMDFINEMRFLKLEKLNLAQNSIVNIPANISECLPSLVELDLSFNEVVQCDIRKLVVSLNKLNLIGNPVETLDRLEFSRFSLKHAVIEITDATRYGALDVFSGHNPSLLRKLIDNSIACLCNVSLKELHISKLDASHGTIVSTEGLMVTGATEINLSNNKLKSFEYRIEDGKDASHHTLVTLNLAGNSLNDLHFSAVASSLKHLYVENNKLELIDVSKMPSLQILHANNNRIKQLDIKDMRNIQLVNLGSNKLEGIIVRNATELTLLNLDDNVITDCKNVDVSEEVWSPLTLFLSKNNITKCHNLDSTVDSFTMKGHSLHKLSLVTTTDDSEGEIQLPSSENLLRFLDLCDGRISRITKDAFAKCENLEKLFLDGNELLDLDWSILYPAKKLEILSLARNKLQFITFKHMRKQLSALRTLNLSHNEIRHFDVAVSRHFPKLSDLYLNNNRLRRFGYPNLFVARRPRDMLKLISMSAEKKLKLFNSVTFESLESIDLSHNYILHITLTVYTYQKLTESSLRTNPVADMRVMFDDSFDSRARAKRLLGLQSIASEPPVLLFTYTRDNCTTAADSYLAIKNVISLAAMSSHWENTNRTSAQWKDRPELYYAPIKVA